MSTTEGRIPAIPWKTWMRMMDALVDHCTQRTYESESALLELETLTGWPWTGSVEQRQEWAETCRRLNP